MVAERPVLRLSPADLVALIGPLLFALAVLSLREGIPDWPHLVSVLVATAALAPLARTLAAISPHPLAHVVGSFYPILTLWVCYSRLNGLIDAASPVTYDRELQAIDLAWFGGQASVLLAPRVQPLVTELLFLAYAAFFVWQVWLGAILYARGGPDYPEYLRLVLLFYFLSFASYALVPAIGPRFDLAGAYPTALEGVLVGGAIERSFYGIPMLRDCFPSGHTGLTLLVLASARRFRARAFFFGMAPFGLLLIFSTVYCRFHYLVDLVMALPFITGVVLIDRALAVGLAGGLEIPLPEGRRIWVGQAERRASRVAE